MSAPLYDDYYPVQNWISEGNPNCHEDDDDLPPPPPQRPDGNNPPPDDDDFDERAQLRLDEDGCPNPRPESPVDEVLRHIDDDPTEDDRWCALDPHVYRMAAAWCRGTSIEAHDVRQEVFISLGRFFTKRMEARQKAPARDEEEPVTCGLLRFMIRNAIADAMRRLTLGNQVLCIGSVPEPTSNDETPSQVAELRELHDYLLRLPAHQRHPVQHVLAGHSGRQAAKALGMSDGTFRRNLFCAVEALRARFAGPSV